MFKSVLQGKNKIIPIKKIWPQTKWEVKFDLRKITGSRLAGVIWEIKIGIKENIRSRWAVVYWKVKWEGVNWKVNIGFIWTGV